MQSLALRTLQREHALLMLARHEFDLLMQQKTLALPERHREHFGKVLRRHKSWSALACDGQGVLVKILASVNKVVLTEEIPITIARQHIGVRLVQAWIKPKALSLVLQKAAELGAEEITLVATTHSAAPSEKVERMEAILENACMQAYNPFKPKLKVGTFDDVTNFTPNSTYFGDLAATTPLYKIFPQQASEVTFCNGPEGGFSAAELDYLRTQGFGVLLSENVLRSETAAIIALGHFCQLP